MKTWQTKLIAAAALIYVTAATILLAVTLTITYHGEQHIESVQHSNLAASRTQASELSSLQSQTASMRTLVQNEAESSAYLKTGVADLRTILVYIGGMLTAICTASPGCVPVKT